MVYDPPFARTPAVDNLCMEIAECVGKIRPNSELATSPTLHRHIRIRTIHSSLLIEGNELSESVVSAIIDGKPVLGPAKDIREVENARRAYEKASSLDPFLIENLLAIHGVMMEGLDGQAGAFRTGNIGVFAGEKLIHAGTPAKYVPQLVEALFSWLRSTDLHPLVASCIFHYEFEFIHPFADGNGRMGRLWHTLLLAQWRPVLAWLPIETVILRRQQGYYDALAYSNKEGDCAPFVEFMLKVIRDSMFPYIEDENDEEMRTKQTLDYFAAHPKGTVTELAEILGCSKRSAERIVASLKESGRLIREGSPRAGLWSVVLP